jgi:transglutaminase-like putative cysteine protease
VSRLAEWRPTTLVVSLLAALTTWVTLLAWTKFAEFPAGYMVPLLGACLIVAVGGMVMRSARVPAVVVAAGQVVLLLLWLHHRLTGDWVPTPSTVGTALDAVRQAGVAAQTFAAPVPVSVPEFYPLLIVAGAATAVLVDFLAVGLRRAPLAGLPLLAAYTAPVSILDGGVSMLKFAAAALCFLFLIAAEEDGRLAHWGHHLTPRGGPFESRSSVIGGAAVWSSARKIGVAATALAAVVPLLMPTFSATLFGGGSGGGRGDGESVNISNPMVDLKRDLSRGADVELLRMTTSDPDPSYLRISVLNSFDGEAWRPSGRNIPVKQRANGEVPPAPGLQSAVRTRQHRATISTNDFFRSRWLPTPYPVSSVDAPGDWRYDRSTMDFISAADDQTTADLRYRLTSLELSPTAQQLANALPAPVSVFGPNTTLPRNFPTSVRTLAQRVTEGRSTKFEQAVALQEWFRVGGGFRYSLARSSGNGTDDLVAFLKKGPDGRVGYCEQFAAAMATMGRTLGIPSRVAVGFLHPQRSSGSTWAFSTHDLHAWPEMYFGGVGWVRFEPTPQGRAGDVPAYTTQQVPQAPATSSSSAPSAAPSVNRVDKSTNAAAAAANQGGGGSPGPGELAAWIGLPLLLVLLALAPRGLRVLVRRRRWAAADDPAGWVEAAWLELRDTAVDLGVAWDDHVTLRTSATALEGSFGSPGEPDDALSRGGQRGPGAAPEATRALHRLVRLVERARYARALPEDATTCDEVVADLELCVASLRAGAGRQRRTRAGWLPASLLSQPRTRRRSRRRRALVGGPGVDRAV